MRHPYGEHRPAWRRVDWRRIRTELERFVAVRPVPPVVDTDADTCATSFVRSLQDAVLALDTQPSDFEEAVRKAEHVEDLRRVLGILLDVLADWEMVATRDAGPT